MRRPDYIAPDFIKLVLQEDIGRGDITTTLLGNRVVNGVATLKAKEDLILCGVDLAAYLFDFIDETLQVDKKSKDGERLNKGDEILVVSGDAASILKGERVVLNFLQRASGIASLTALYVKNLAEGSKTKIVDTRKTTPGLRSLEKYAVRTGGGVNHRFGLDDGVMIKDNHIILAGSITEAVKSIRARAHHLLKIEVETSNLDQVAEAVRAKADVIMLDNMSREMAERAIKIIDKSAIVEISGGITLEKIRELSLLNADFISVGALTHSAVAKDINLTLKI